MKRPAPMTGTIIPSPGRATLLCHICAHIAAVESNFDRELMPDHYRQAVRRLDVLGDIDPLTGKDIKPCYEREDWLHITFPNMEHRPDVRIVEWCHILDILVHDAAVAYLRLAINQEESLIANNCAMASYDLFMISAELRKGAAVEAFRRNVERALVEW